MIYLPGLNTDDECIKMTQGQKIATVLISYTITAIFASIFFLTLWNTYFFLYKQQKYKVYPLLLFYILSFTAIILRMYHSFWMIEVVLYQQVFAIIGPTWVKFSIGIVQILTMTELTLRIE